jgi:predicted ATPase
VQTLVDDGKLPQVCADFVKSFHGAALIVAGDKEAGVEIMDRTVGSLGDFGFWGFPISTVYALALSDSGRSEEALSHIDAVLNSDAGGGANWWLAELHRTRGEVLIRVSTQNESKACDCFEQALKISTAQKNRILELRASMSLARLLNATGETKKARSVLAPVYERFTEGRETVDLRDARILLESFA